MLIFDHADDPAVLAAPGATSPADHVGWLRPDPRGIVIVTTRVMDARTWGPGISLRKLSPLEDEAAAQVLADLAPAVRDPDGQQARELGHRLGGLPLALHLAGSYLASPFARWRTFAEYRRALDSVELPVALADLGDSAAARALISSGPGTCRLMPWPPTTGRRHGRCCSCCRATRPPPPYRSGCCGRAS